MCTTSTACLFQFIVPAAEAGGHKDGAVEVTTAPYDRALDTANYFSASNSLSSGSSLISEQQLQEVRGAPLWPAQQAPAAGVIVC